eukprot:TRINITY_DN1282_c1_g1_i1.p1 TRINITY_DN1282_c1_g1~~TRINITY_DN1282_c1_g1_i1.p1  ORF type:complete len:790 (+),score=195.96 TRINITY_DN1282_c1_g1_i1:302-2371(+)
MEEGDACPYLLDDVSVLSFNTFTPHMVLVSSNSSVFTWPELLNVANTEGGLNVGGVPPAAQLFHEQLKRMDPQVDNLHFVAAVSTLNSVMMLQAGEVSAIWGTAVTYFTYPTLLRPVTVASKVMMDCLPDVPSMSDYGYDVTAGVDRGLAVSGNVPNATQLQLAKWITLAGKNASFLAEARAAGYMPEFMITPTTSQYVAQLYREYHDELYNHHKTSLVGLVAIAPSALGVAAVAIVVISGVLLYQHKRRQLLVDFERDIQEKVLSTSTPATRVLKTLLELQHHVPKKFESQIVEASRLLVSASLNRVDIGKAELEEDAADLLKGLMTFDVHSETASSTDVVMQQFDRESTIDGIDMPWCYDHYDKIMALVPTFTGWDYDPYKANDAMGGHLLQAFISYFFVKAGLTTAYNIDITKLCRFAEAVEESYHSDNPFHNQVHAADVLQATYYLITRPSVTPLLAEDSVFVALVSAAIHDCGHTGRTNAFMIETRSDLALTYNDIAVLESNSLAIFFKICAHESHNIFHDVPDHKRKVMRKRIIEAVLATDLTVHFAFLSQLKNKLSVGFSPASSDEDMSYLLRTIIKAADLSNLARPGNVSRKWTAAIAEEFFQQGDEEKTRRMHVSAFMDRTQPRVDRSQVVFIDNIVLQLWQLCSQMVRCDDIVALVARNRDMWDKSALASHHEHSGGTS